MQAITLAAPPQARQVFTSMSPKAPTFGEYPLEPLRPAHGGMALGGSSVLWFIGRGGLAARAPPGRRDQCPVFTVRGKHAVETGQVHSWFGYQGRQSGQKIQRLEDHVGGAVAPGCLERVADVAVFGE